MSNRPVLEEGSGPPYLRAALGLSRDWIISAACRGTPEASRRYWDAEPQGQGCKPHAARIAREFCRNCPAQWDCVIYAIESYSDYGTWAVHAPDRKLLKAQEDWKALVEAARAEGISIAALMLTMREPRPYEGVKVSKKKSTEKQVAAA